MYGVNHSVNDRSIPTLRTQLLEMSDRIKTQSFQYFVLFVLSVTPHMSFEYLSPLSKLFIW